MKIIWTGWVWMIAVLFCYNVHASGPAQFSLESSSFLDEGAMPVLYTCDGKDVPPQISFKDVPSKSRYLALILSDEKDIKSAKLHWIVINLPSHTKEMAEASEKVPPNAVLIKNSFDKFEYMGPCPERGTAHEYFFTAFAYLDPITERDASTVIAQLTKKGTEARMSGVYSRWIGAKS